MSVAATAVESCCSLPAVLARSSVLYSVTLLKTKEALDNLHTAAEASYRCFETKMNFETEWYVLLTAFLPVVNFTTGCQIFNSEHGWANICYCYYCYYYYQLQIDIVQTGTIGRLERSQLCASSVISNRSIFLFLNTYFVWDTCLRNPLSSFAVKMSYHSSVVIKISWSVWSSGLSWFHVCCSDSFVVVVNWAFYVCVHVLILLAWRLILMKRSATNLYVRWIIIHFFLSFHAS